MFFIKGEPTKNIWYWEHKLPNRCNSYSKSIRLNISEFDTLKKWWKSRKANEQAWKVDIKTIQANGYNLDIKNPHQPEEEKQYSSGKLLDLLLQSFGKGDALLARLSKELYDRKKSNL